MGTRIRSSAAAATCAGKPCASLPNSQAVGPASMVAVAGANRSRSPSAVAASRRSPARRHSASTVATSRSRATGRWKTLPAEPRTHLPLCGSTASPASTTASAPAASATRITVPALPGSDASSSTTTSLGAPASASATDTSIRPHTASRPCGVTVSDSAAAARSVMVETGMAAAEATASSSVLRAAAASVANTSNTLDTRWPPAVRPAASSVLVTASGPENASALVAEVSAAPTACAPSARNRPARSRPARRSSLRAATTLGVRSVQIRRASGIGAAIASGRGVVLGRAALGRHVRLGQLDQRGEGGRVAHRELGEDLAVDLHLSQAQALDETVVGNPVGAGGGVDPGDPQLPEVALASPAVPVGVVQRVEHLLLRLAVQPGALAAVAASQLEGRPTLLLGVDRPLHACHCFSSFGHSGGRGRRLGLVSAGERSSSPAEQLADPLGVGTRDFGGAGEPTGLLAGLDLEPVPQAGLLPEQLAAAGDLDALLDPAVRLVLGHG